MAMKPPSEITPAILNHVAEISRLLGQYEGLQVQAPQPQLRRQNRMRSIQGSLAIEGNTLDLDQVTAILENKRVVGPKKDILEVQNALALYDRTRAFSFSSEKDLLKAHRILMQGIDPNAGKLRAGGVGVLKGRKVVHVAPSAKLVPKLIGDLFAFIRQEKSLSPLITSAVFHYEFEFIHPFGDGNGRMGRFWQHLILTSYHAAFEYIPFESVIKDNQKEYYRVLEQCDKAGSSTRFIEFSLETTLIALREFLSELRPPRNTPDSRLASAQEHFAGREFTRKEYMTLVKTVSTATASRDLAFGVNVGLLRQTGTKALARYRFLNSGR